MSGFIELGAGCALVSALTVITPTESGWREEVTYEVQSAGGCTAVRLRYDPNTAIERLGGQRQLGDGTRGKLTDERFVIPAVGADGSAAVRVLLPELLSGDRALVETEHSWSTDGSYRWQPGRSGAAWSELEAGKGASLSTFGEVQADRRRGTAWVTDATPRDEAHVLAMRSAPEPRLGEVATAALSLTDALERMRRLVLQPRVLEREPMSGDAAIARGVVDDRGWARTLVALTAGGMDKVELGWRMPAQARPAATEDAEAEVAVWWSEAGPVPVMHPASESWTAHVHTESTHQMMSWERESAGPASADLVLNREMTLSWDGDPAYELAPGRHSRVDVIDELAVPEDTAALVIVPLPRVADGLSVTGQGARTWRAPTAVLVAVDRGPSRTVTLTWGHPDAPTFGEKPSAEGLRIDMQVRADGKVRWESGAWWLADAEGTPILPSREALLRALEYRFGVASYPEPGLPLILNGRAGGGWEVLDDLRAGMSERTRPGALQRPVLWPRRLMRARRYGVLTESEAMLLATRWAQQLRFDATWTLVRPAARGPGAAVSPAGYDHGLVRIAHDGEVRWMDPSCTVCAPWEIRPDLEGASALGWDVSETPGPTAGSMRVTQRDEDTVFTLEGSAALALRLQLRDAIGPSRAAILADLLAPGGVVLATEGIGEAGAPITATIRGGTPRLWPDADREGTWMTWVGPRVLASEGHPAEYDGDGLHWERKVADDGAVIEVLDVRRRRITAETRAAVEAARSAPPVEAPTPEQDGALPDSGAEPAPTVPEADEDSGRSED